jgi:hypothetical protein
VITPVLHQPANSGLRLRALARHSHPSSVGYDFLYESSVLRPTDQIDRSFSKGLPFLQDPNSTTGPIRRFKTTDFYAQGVSLGVAFRF